MKTKIFIGVVLCLFLFQCKQGGSPESPKLPSYPTITSFSANPSTIKRATESTLSWNATNCTSASIDQGIGTVSPSGSVQVKPLEDTTYTLTATNADGSSTKTCLITVENGANIVMISGPTYKDPWLYTDDYFSYFGKAKNKGTYEASFVKVYIYLYNKNGKMIDYEDTYVDKTDLKPGESSPWEVVWFDEDRAIRSKLDKSRTEYEFEWSEYTWVVRTGRKSIYEIDH